MCIKPFDKCSEVFSADIELEKPPQALLKKLRNLLEAAMAGQHHCGHIAKLYLGWQAESAFPLEEMQPAMMQGLDGLQLEPDMRRGLDHPPGPTAGGKHVTASITSRLTQIATTEHRQLHACLVFSPVLHILMHCVSAHSCNWLPGQPG